MTCFDEHQLIKRKLELEDKIEKTLDAYDTGLFDIYELARRLASICVDILNLRVSDEDYQDR